MVLKQLDDNTAVCFWLKRRSFSCIKHTVSSNREIVLRRYHLPIKTPPPPPPAAAAAAK